VLNIAGPNTIATVCTGCLEVASTAYPQTSWNIPLIHVAFENSAAVAAGIDCALKVMGKREGVNIIAFGGDGGTFDIGIQALSGMLERGHRVMYVCLDNEAYMNTGIQRCSSTPYGAATTTSPAGKYSIGEQRPKKPIGAICAVHDIPYTATATIAYPKDLERKVKRALAIDGPTFIHILAPCPTGWRYSSELTIELSRLAVQTGIFLLWEVEGGDLADIKITHKLKRRKPVLEYLKYQGRFSHILDNKKVIDAIQREVDAKLAKYGM
jgi:pyruvate ferredoxin oxidoreductase beta subunit